VLLQIARSRSLPNPGWPSHVAALCRLVHGVFTVDAMPVVQSPDLWADLADSAEGAVPSDVANTLVTVPNMPSALQRLLLCPPRPLTVVLAGQEQYKRAALYFRPQLRLIGREAFEAQVTLGGPLRGYLQALHSDMHAVVSSGRQVQPRLLAWSTSWFGSITRHGPP